MTLEDIIEAARLAEAKSDGIVTVWIEARSEGIFVEGVGRRDRFSKEWRARKAVGYRDAHRPEINPLRYAVNAVFTECREAVRSEVAQ